MSKRSHLILAIGLLVLGAALTFFKIPLASSQGLTLVVEPVEGNLPLNDADSPLWQQATAQEVPLSLQNVTKPYLLESKIRSVTARLLQNQEQIAVLVEWADETKNDAALRPQDFRDAVAVQFPLIEGQPYFCMGQQGGNVNIWHWKADWQADIVARQDMETQYADMYVDQYPFADPALGLAAGVADYQDPNYIPALEAGNLFASPARSTPVEDLIAGSFGTLTAQPAAGQNVSGFGAWSDGSWRVIFSRDLTSQEADDLSFASGKTYSIAFAVWDGANGERNGQKSTSQWVSLQIKSPQKAPIAQEPAAPEKTSWFTTGRIGMLVLGLVLFLILVELLIYYRLPE
ncbi:MAG TPA: ethylbenzene dehydrogenase-related protein [Anaerolineales bacterium]|nr:ethylbenzene dehydrogenase-related protein [Anaerolineales bacterium]